MAKTNAPTQDFVSIRDIKDNVIIQKDGKMTMILLASSINFALKSAIFPSSVAKRFAMWFCRTNLPKPRAGKATISPKSVSWSVISMIH